MLSLNELSRERFTQLKFLSCNYTAMLSILRFKSIHPDFFWRFWRIFLFAEQAVINYCFSFPEINWDDAVSVTPRVCTDSCYRFHVRRRLDCMLRNNTSDIFQNKKTFFKKENSLKDIFFVLIVKKMKFNLNIIT